MYKLLLLLFLSCTLLAGCSDSEHSTYDSSEPIKEAKIFAKGLISEDLVAAPRFSPDGKTLFFHKPDRLSGHYQIFVSYYIDDAWTKPELPEFAISEASEGDMYFTPDGTKLFFVSNRESGFPERQWNYGLWVVDRTATGWGKPTYLSDAVNSYNDNIAYPTVASNGNLYFLTSEGINLSRFIDGKYQPREVLKLAEITPEQIFIPYIAHDESYLIQTGLEPSSEAPMFIRYNRNGVWSKPKQLSSKLIGGRFAFVSPDGQYLFFSKDDGIYQIEMSETGIEGT
ncbi:TolB family protein [Paenibacillus psychroresistens]|uniref:TolB family protein n=1 Tax=Paenibacillus psychroresistens TaxID=1778678 RepID=UPI001391B8F7|nr:PD40 domain-containing protein [Paenibacillus psychroresistens]